MLYAFITDLLNRVLRRDLKIRRIIARVIQVCPRQGHADEMVTIRATGSSWEWYISRDRWTIDLVWHKSDIECRRILVFDGKCIHDGWQKAFCQDADDLIKFQLSMADIREKRLMREHAAEQALVDDIFR